MDSQGGTRRLGRALGKLRGLLGARDVTRYLCLQLGACPSDLVPGGCNAVAWLAVVPEVERALWITSPVDLLPLILQDGASDALGPIAALRDESGETTDA